MTIQGKCASNCGRAIALFIVTTLSALAFVSTASVSTAADAPAKSKSGYGQYNPDDPSVDLFQAIDDGQVDVKFIPKDSTQANVVITNKSKTENLVMLKHFGPGNPDAPLSR